MPIEKRDFDQLMNQARIECTGASEAGLRSTLFEVLKEFLGDSQIWTEDIFVTVTPPIQDYSLIPKEGLIRELYGVWDSIQVHIAAVMDHAGTLHLMHPPSSPGNPYQVRVIKTVALPTNRDGVPVGPHWLLPLYSAHVLDGLLARMMQQANKSYSDDGKAGYHLARFRAGIALAHNQKSHANTVGAQAWSFPQSFRSQGQKGGVSTAWPYGYGGS